MRRIEPVLRRALRGPCRVAPGARILVACSGGADSTALLVGLVSIAGTFEVEVVVAHLDHGLRGAEATQDLEHVRALCNRLGVPLISRRWNTLHRMRVRGLSGESGLRILRREFLAAAARQVEAVAIATGHHADDQLETLLMRLTRGTGLPGLGGMTPRRGRWLKPLLEATREDVEADLVRARIPWRVDGSNADCRMLRNFLRHDVIGAWSRGAASGASALPTRRSLRGRLARNAVAATAEARSAGRWIERVAARLLGKVCRIERMGIRLDSSVVASYPLALRCAIVRRAWKRVAPDSVGLTRRHLGSIEGLLAPARGHAEVHLPQGFVAFRDGEWLCWEQRQSVRNAGAARGMGR